MDSETFGEYIKKRRIEAGLALREVAGKVDFDQSLLSKIERNKMIAPAKIIRGLADCLDIPYKELQIKYLSEKIYQELKQIDFSRESLAVAARRLENENSGTTKEIERNKLIQKMNRYFQDQPIEKVWLFGSFARQNESYDSDVDLLVKFTDSQKLDLFDYIGIRHDLEDLTGRQVDLIEEGQEMEKIKPIIEKEKKLIYEREAV